MHDGCLRSRGGRKFRDAKIPLGTGVSDTLVKVQQRFQIPLSTRPSAGPRDALARPASPVWAGPSWPVHYFCTSFTLAVDRPSKNSQGEREADFIDVTGGDSPQSSSRST